jgi:hypothetical protein
MLAMLSLFAVGRFVGATPAPAGTLIDREIALEHRTLRAEGGDTGLDIGPPGLLQILRGGRLGLIKEYCRAENATATSQVPPGTRAAPFVFLSGGRNR